MAYTDPPDFTAGDPLAADELDVLSEDIRFLYARSEGTTWSAVQAYRSSNQAIADSTEEAVIFNIESFDAGGWFDGNDTKIIVPASAIPDGATVIAVEVDAEIEWDSDNAGVRRAIIHVNGASAGSRTIDAMAGGGTPVTINRKLTVEAADEIELIGYQTSGSGLNVTFGFISVTRLGVVS